ncbi:MAG: tetratricopeptide repeat protein [Spirochaetota bacterium]
MMYSQGKKSGGESNRGWIRGVVVGLAIVLVAGGVVAALGALDAVPFGIPRRDTELVALWNDRRYDDVLAAAEAILAERPFDGEALTFAGFAHFYIGIEVVQRVEQLEHIDASIELLRKALHVPRAPLAAERDYVLAKAYYHKDDQYVDLAVRYMERSLERGFESPDSRTYLGMGYARLGAWQESVEWFERALELASTADMNALRVKAAEAYVELGDYASARRTLRRAIESLDDAFLVLMARNQLASVLILDGALDEAEELLEQTIEQFPESADAYYYLGIVYDQTDRGVQARDLWRTAREIDPNHTEALRRLANWGG